MKRTKIISRFEKNRKLARLVPAVLLILLVMVAATAVAYANKYAKTSADQQVKLQNTQTQLLKTNQELNNTKVKSQQDNSNSKDQIQKLEEQKKDLESQLQAKIDQKTKLAEAQKLTAAPAVVAKSLVANVVSGCGGDTFANYIYSHESSCNLTATNAEGCVGIGQACPASKLLAVCPDLSYDCQHGFFTAYAVGRYGSWEGAYNFWLSNHWW